MKNSTMVILVGLGMIFSGLVILEVPIAILYLILRENEKAEEFKNRRDTSWIYAKPEEKPVEVNVYKETQEDKFFHQMGIKGIVTKE